MINLIPHSAKKSVRREYLARVVTVWCLLGGVMFLILLVLLLPIHALVTIKVTGTTDASNEVKVVEEEQKQLLELLQMSQQQAIAINNQANRMVPFHELLAVVDAEVFGIRLNEYRFSTTARKPTLIVTGVAPSRLALAAFRDRLAQNSLFTNVELPISALVRDRDIPFTMTMFIATSTPSV